MNIEQLLDEYRNGNENRRLSMFLFYREFRDDFSQIDDEELDAGAIPGGTENRSRRMFRRKPNRLRESTPKNSSLFLKFSFLLSALSRALDKLFPVCYDTAADENAKNHANSGIE